MSEHQGLPARLRELRAARRMAQDRLAEAIGVSKSLVSQFESGKAIPQAGTAQRLDELFGTGTEIQEQARTAHEDLRPWMRPWHEHERRAYLLRIWEPMLIPGLLQCEPYMWAVFSAVPRNAGRIDTLMAARRERQANTINREHPTPVPVSTIIGEIALRRGPRDVLKAQLGHLADVTHQRHVKVRVVPIDGEGIHVGLSGPFHIATLPDGRRFGQMDDQLIGHPVTGAGDLGHLELAWEEIDALALPVIQSRDLILRILDEYK
ncbi:helix-turn-helix transcriptional regulator [Plantactinospora sp. KBS50]|uniref:helix-turn-helix domain-containing protein n=1 Tax=Plantactinospora sp. KBS50 TaxID=2024580 RepID=UPI0012FE4414|nr:helix-turn-helix transcriptional regulator [Plantactinospora sp. KBS50]